MMQENHIYPDWQLVWWIFNRGLTQVVFLVILDFKCE